MDFTQNVLILLSRICISFLYLWAGSAKITDWKGTIAYMQSRNFPLIPLMLPGAVIAQIAGGLSLLLGLYCRWGTLILIFFTIPAMIKMHAFWKESGNLRLTEKIMFMKDLAILGGLLLLWILGAGAFSLDTLLIKN